MCLGGRSTGHAPCTISEQTIRELKCCPQRLRTTIEAIRLMANKSGTADLPLHGGRVPKWLADRMTSLGAVIGEGIIHHYGRGWLLRRLAPPFWFQSFGAVMGMDWHSSGITTSVIGALKRGLAPLATELGIQFAEAAASTPGRPRTSWSRLASGSDLTAPLWPEPVALSPRSIAPRCRMGSTCTCTASS